MLPRARTAALMRSRAGPRWHQRWALGPIEAKAPGHSVAWTQITQHPAGTGGARRCITHHERATGRHQPVTAEAFARHLEIIGLDPATVAELFEGRRGPEACFPFAVALSGGADSMALMLLLREYLDLRAIPTPLLAITIDHQLRPESAEEAHTVGAMCRRWPGIEHVIASCQWGDAAPPKSKLQEAARAYRYELLARACRVHGVRCLFVAHNEGDQLETVLFRLGRASGINGLAGIAPRTPLVDAIGDRDDIQLATEVVRPLLAVPKRQLRATCERFGQEWVEDPSNQSLVFDRIRIRKELERLEDEALAVDDGQSPTTLALLSQFQEAARRAKDEFELAERALLDRHIRSWGTTRVVVSMDLLDDPESFDALTTRALARIIRQVGAKDLPPRSSSLALFVRDLRRLKSGKKVTLGGCCVTKRSRRQELDFEPERSSSSC